jgi:hypothetical protein
MVVPAAKMDAFAVSLILMTDYITPSKKRLGSWNFY